MIYTYLILKFKKLSIYKITKTQIDNIVMNSNIYTVEY